MSPNNHRRAWGRSVRRRGVMAASALSIVVAGAGGSHAASCGSTAAGFAPWLEQVKADAARQGISRGAVDSALAGVSYDPNVVRLDRSQRSFKLTFEQFYARRVSSSLISRAKQKMQSHRDLLERIEKRFGVPPQVIVAIWGLETNFGGDGSGKHSIVRSVATLAYDCRRPEFFKRHLMSALRIVQKGDMSPSEMRGGWAGEIGPMQFMPEAYLNYAVDFDGNGRKDLMHSVPDMLASTANYLKGHGWRAGQGWQPGSANYNVIAEWNKAEVYQRTIAVLADKLR